MLKGVIFPHLKNALGHYVLNLNEEQLHVGIWSGKVVLRDLALNREAFDELHLPYDIVEGYLGELTINIPWSTLVSNQPLTVFLDGVYILLGPRRQPMITEEEHVRQFPDTPIKLAGFEIDIPKIYIKPNMFAEQRIIKMLYNSHISVTNIHLHYKEDHVSAPQQSAAVAITSESLVTPTNKNRIHRTIGNAIKGIRKGIGYGIKLLLRTMKAFYEKMISAKEWASKCIPKCSQNDDALQQLMAEKVAEWEQKIQALRSQHQEELAVLQQLHSSKIAEMEEVNTKLESECQSLKLSGLVNQEAEALIPAMIAQE